MDFEIRAAAPPGEEDESLLPKLASNSNQSAASIDEYEYYDYEYDYDISESLEHFDWFELGPSLFVYRKTKIRALFEFKSFFREHNAVILSNFHGFYASECIPKCAFHSLQEFLNKAQNHGYYLTA